MSPHTQDQVNRAWYTHPWSMDGLARQQGFTDEGERAAYWRLADEMRNRAILDLGVGPGRTVTLLRALSADYVGVDYLPAMVERAHALNQFADIRVGDARDLSDFPDGRFQLVAFSYCGIDSVSHVDRQRVLAEVRRVLAPGGVFWFSTLNQHGPAWRYRPWRPPVTARPPRRLLGWVRYDLQRLRAYAHVPRHWLNYRQVLPLTEQGEGWAVAPFFAGDWRMLTHYVTLDRQLADLAAAGFLHESEVYEDSQGRRVFAGEDNHGVVAFNILARRP